MLKDGDTVTFGHKQGRDIEPGQYAPQPSSEFRFIVREQLCIYDFICVFQIFLLKVMQHFCGSYPCFGFMCVLV